MIDKVRGVERLVIPSVKYSLAKALVRAPFVERKNAVEQTQVAHVSDQLGWEIIGTLPAT
jgi:hypothetical protein